MKIFIFWAITLLAFTTKAQQPLVDSGHLNIPDLLKNPPQIFQLPKLPPTTNPSKNGLGGVTVGGGSTISRKSLCSAFSHQRLNSWASAESNSTELSKIARQALTNILSLEYSLITRKNLNLAEAEILKAIQEEMKAWSPEYRDIAVTFCLRDDQEPVSDLSQEHLQYVKAALEYLRFVHQQ